ncbi:GMC oxidoreductase (plasmid) [Sphingomonas zeae]
MMPSAAASRFAACVIGSGAAGAVVADTLVRAGLDVVVVEEGARVPASLSNEMLDAASPSALARAVGGEWVERGWPWTTRNLGGGTLFYGGASFRYRAFDFDATDRIHVDDLDVRWPITLADLEPYYAEIERRLAVDPATVGDWQVPQPPTTLSLPGERLWQGALARGYRPQPTPVAIDRTRCNNCSLCICTQCARGAKRDALTAFLAPHEGDARLTVMTGTRAVSLRQTRQHRADEILCLDLETGTERRIHADLFVIAGNAIQSAALLLRSTSSFHPRGMGNRHDMVGRGLCMKLSEYSVGDVDCPAGYMAAHPVGYRGPFSTVSVLDHYLDERCPTGVGGLIYEAKYDEPGSLRTDRLVLRVETILADHPSVNNRVRLAGKTDRWGTPLIVIDYRPDPRDVARLTHMKARSAEWLAASGAERIGHEASGYAFGSTHLHGTCRAGDDPRRSVVDRDGRVHELDNVFVADGGYMPYPGGLNPTLTIQANALRIARALLPDGVNMHREIAA